MTATPAMTAPAIMPTEAPAVCTQSGSISDLCIQRIEKTTPFGINSMRRKCYTGLPSLSIPEIAHGCQAPHAKFMMDGCSLRSLVQSCSCCWPRDIHRPLDLDDQANLDGIVASATLLQALTKGLPSGLPHTLSWTRQLQTLHSFSTRTAT